MMSLSSDRKLLYSHEELPPSAESLEGCVVSLVCYETPLVGDETLGLNSFSCFSQQNFAYFSSLQLYFILPVLFSIVRKVLEPKILKYIHHV